MQLTSLLMASLYAPTWTARKLDKKVTAQAKAANGVDESTDAGNFNKLILPDCPELKACGSYIGHARQWFYLRTAPWGEQRGTRVLKAEEYMDTMASFGDLKAGLVPVLAAFEAVYPEKIALMEYELQGMFNVNDYPSWDVVASKFQLVLSVQPLPNAADVRVLTEIPQHIRDEIEQELMKEQNSVYEASIKHALEKLMAPVAHMAKQLKAYQDGETKKIYASLVDNVREMGEAASRLNIARDPEIEKLAAAALSLVDGVTQKDLKDSDGFRVEQQRKAEALARRIAAVMP